VEVERELPNLPMAPPGRSIVWSGVALLALIELVVMAALIASYYYLRLGHPLWPPPGVDMPELLDPALAHGLLLLSGAIMVGGYRGLRSRSIGRIKVALPLGLLFVLGYLALTWMALTDLEYTHQTHAYGSIVWTLNGYEMLHATGVFFAGLAVWVMLLVHPFGLRASAGVESLTLYWLFVALVGIPVYLVVYVSPYIL
jgi:heme/copper-type cytochrome/quinol oxidase subunit 3